MVDVRGVLSEAGFQLPSFETGGITSILLFFLILIIFAGILFFVTWWMLNYLKYNQRIILFKKVGKTVMPIRTIKGTVVNISKAGDRLLKTKIKLLPMPAIMMGKNVWWYFEREDGEWINIGLEDINERMKEVKAYFVDEDMRLHRIGIQKQLDAEFNKPSFWERYGGMIMYTIFIIIVCVVIVILIDRIVRVLPQISQMADAVKQMASAVHNLQGSGVVEVG